jgi:hypothetical protein
MFTLSTTAGLTLETAAIIPLSKPSVSPTRTKLPFVIGS